MKSFLCFALLAGRAAALPAACFVQTLTVTVRAAVVTVSPIPADPTVTTTSTSTRTVTSTLRAVSAAAAVSSAPSSVRAPNAQFVSAPAILAPIASIVAPIASAVPIPAAPAAVVPAAPAPAASKGRGVAYNLASYANQFTGADSKCIWGYNWAQTSGGLSSAMEYVPMLWGNKVDFTKTWAANANAALASGSKALLAFNEPDHPDQANLSPGAAADLYKQFMQPFAGKARLGSPAVTNGVARADGSPMGLPWLKQWFAACAGCQVDFVAIHWYDSAQNFAYFKSYIQQAYAAGGNRPLWITEFGVSGSQADTASFLSQAIPWLEAQPYVERYAYFGAFDGTLLTGGVLNQIGKLFMTSV